MDVGGGRGSGTGAEGDVDLVAGSEDDVGSGAGAKDDGGSKKILYL